MAKEGIPFILVFVVLAAIAFVAGLWLGSVVAYVVAGLAVALALFMAYFFRDPHRDVPEEANIVVSPADGKVMVVERVDPNDPASPTQVSIFLSPMDVHINR